MKIKLSKSQWEQVGKTAGWLKKETEVDYSKYMTSTPESGGEYYRLDIPIGVPPPDNGTKLDLNGKAVITLTPKSSLDIARGRGGPVAQSMDKNGIAYLVNCLPEGHERLKN